MAQERIAPGPVSGFFRFLYATYSRGTRLSHFFSSRISAAGWLLLGLLVISIVLGADMARSSLYQIFALVSAVLGVSMFWAFSRRAALTARRRMPRYATVDEDCTYTIEVTNQGRGKVRGFLLWDRPPDPRPGLRMFAFTREPGEEKRNLFDRVFVYYRWRWLVEGRILFTGGRSRDPLILAPGETRHVRVQLAARRRGVIQLRDLRVMLPDPFGIFHRCRRVEAQVDSLIVLPQRYRLPPLELPGQACSQLGGEALSNSIGQSGEFLGLREYRAGDALRHIHWKSWAKAGKPIVKEFEDVFFPRYGLVLDTFVQDGDEILFEEAVSVAASFAASIDTRRTLLDLMFIKDEAITVTAGRGMAKAEKLLEVLAGVEPETNQHFDALLNLVQRHRDDLTVCLCVFSGWSAARGEFLREVVSRGLETVALIVCHDEAELRIAVERDGIPCRHLLLEHSRVQEGLLRL